MLFIAQIEKPPIKKSAAFLFAVIFYTSAPSSINP